MRLESAALDRRALAALVDEHADRVLTYADRVTGIAFDALGYARDTFVDAIVEARATGGSAGDPARQVLQSARAVVWRRDEIRRGGDPDPAAPPPSEQELQAALRAANLELPVRQREVLVLREAEELSYEVIAQVMALSPLAVAQLSWQAFGRLRSLLEGRPGGVSLASPDCGRMLTLAMLADDGPLPPEATAWMGHHTAGCARCRASPTAIADARATYRRWLRVRAALGVREHIADAVAGVLGVDVAYAAQRAARRRRAAPLPAGLAALVLVSTTSAALHVMDLPSGDGERPRGGAPTPPATISGVLVRPPLREAPPRREPAPRPPVVPEPEPDPEVRVDPRPAPPRPQPSPRPRPEPRPPADPVFPAERPTRVVHPVLPAPADEAPVEVPAPPAPPPAEPQVVPLAPAEPPQPEPPVPAPAPLEAPVAEPVAAPDEDGDACAATA